ncbi:hypothetical protein L1887_61914 [Cichorium endivia]|nr:hypothetical protein L1887_61914 [Cichorium endivia]
MIGLFLLSANNYKSGGRSLLSGILMKLLAFRRSFLASKIAVAHEISQLGELVCSKLILNGFQRPFKSISNNSDRFCVENKCAELLELQEWRAEQTWESRRAAEKKKSACLEFYEISDLRTLIQV